MNQTPQKWHPEVNQTCRGYHRLAVWERVNIDRRSAATAVSRKFVKFGLPDWLSVMTEANKPSQNGAGGATKLWRRRCRPGEKQKPWEVKKFDLQNLTSTWNDRKCNFRFRRQLKLPQTQTWAQERSSKENIWEYFQVTEWKQHNHWVLSCTTKICCTALKRSASVLDSQLWLSRSEDKNYRSVSMNLQVGLAKIDRTSDWNASLLESWTQTETRQRGARSNAPLFSIRQNSGHRWWRAVLLHLSCQQHSSEMFFLTFLLFHCCHGNSNL